MLVSNGSLLTKTVIHRILELARWAPSGDNTQPWRFKIINEDSFHIYTYDTRNWCVYDLDGRASQIAIGALLETIDIAAYGEQMAAHYSYQSQDNALTSESIIQVTLTPLSKSTPHPLIPFITQRCTQRRPFAATPLTAIQKTKLEQAVGNGYRIIWFEGRRLKWVIAKLLFKNAQVRLTIPEAYQVHKKIIEWNAQFSETKIPDQAVGLDHISLKLMHWAMQSWPRVQWLNRYLAGTLIPRIQLDLIPALRCAAHFIIIADQELNTELDFHLGGRAMQKVWLTATSLGLQFQPEMTPLIFSKYVNNSIKFTDNTKAYQQATTLATTLNELVGNNTINSRVFMGRIGTGQQPHARSVRMSVEDLTIS